MERAFLCEWRKNVKKWKIVLISFLAIVVLIGGYVSYLLFFKHYDVADAKVDEIIEEKYEIELPDGTVVEVDGQGNVQLKEGTDVEEGSIGQIIKEIIKNQQLSLNINSSDKQVQENQKNEYNNASSNHKNSNRNEGLTSNGKAINTGSSNVNKKITEKDIIIKYRSTITALESQARGRLDALVEQAKKEYSSKKSNGEKISYSYFYRKYSNAAKELENTTDAAFQLILNAVKIDLKNNGLNIDKAEDLTEIYQNEKEGMRKQILKKVANF